jgi:Tol biopolymer transport system component
MSSVVLRRNRHSIVLSVVLAMVFATLVAVAAQPAQAVFPGGNGWIVFDSGSDIYAMPSDGSAAPTNLTPAGGPVGVDAVADPVFSPDGTKIAFARSQAGLSALWVGTFTPGNPPTLSSLVKVSTPAVGEADGEPTWSPNRATLAFERRVVYDSGKAGTATSDSAGTTLIDTAGNFVTHGVAAGMTVVNATDGSQGVVVSVDSPTQLTLDGLAGGTTDTWAAGDSYTTGHGSLRIFTTPASVPGTDTQLTAAGEGDLWDDLAPAWSPANDLIAFESTRTGAADIFTIPVGGGAELNRTNIGAFDAPAQRPSWSPDGLHIAFHAAEPNTTGNNRNVWRLALPSTFTQLTGESIVGSTGVDDDLFPTFSPDGSLVAFRRAGTGGDTIMDGECSRRIGPHPDPLARALTHNEPDWQPLARRCCRLGLCGR